MRGHPARPHQYASILAARSAYAAGDNITEAVRTAEGRSTNAPHVIEIAYDLQAGSYSRIAESDLDWWSEHGAEIARQLDPWIADGDVLLDCGTGEMTSLIGALIHLDTRLRTMAFDLSWSRVVHGLRFARARLRGHPVPSAFVGDMAAIPLADGAVDVALTVHALEPNGGRERELLTELLRVARRRLVLFEPCYERGSPAAQQRMRAHGYVRDLERTIEALGARVVSVTEFGEITNPRNPTWVLVADRADAVEAPATTFRCPVTGTPLRELHGTMFSDEAGLAYPIIAGIPILRREQAILATDLPAVETPAP